MIKYIAYCRKSTDEKDKQVASIDQQISELKSFAMRENLDVVDYLTEKQSAKIPGRPIFNHIINLIEKREIQGIISWNPDRLARNSMDGGRIIYLLDLGKLTSLKFPTHWFENTPQGRFMLSIAFRQAKYYVDILAQNVHRGLKFKISKGIWPAQAPMGYRNDRNTKTIVIHTHEAKVIRKAYELYATGKYALNDIGKFFYENGIKNKVSGEYPNDSNLRRLLMRPFYYGAMVFKKELYEGKHPPIVSKALFDEVQKVIKQRGWYHQNKSKRYDFPFTGFIKCGYCGYSITAENRPFYFPRTHNKVSYRYYHCTKRKLPCLAKGYTREEVLEKQFRAIIQSVSISKQWADRMLELLEQDEQTEKQQAKQELEKLTIELNEIEQRLDRLLEAYLDTLIESEHYRNKKNELMDKQSIVKDRINQIKQGTPFWIERVKEVINIAYECEKIARAEKNNHLLSQMAKTVGSKYFLRDHRIECSLLPPYHTLASPPPEASDRRVSDPTLAFGQSKYYVDNLSENVKRGNRQKLRKGILPNKAPYGYLNEPRLRTIEVDPAKSKIVKKSFELFAAGENSIADISRFFRKFGITRYNGKMLHLDTIKRLLSNKFYIGIINFGGETYEGTHKLFIPPEIFGKVQKILESREHPKNKKHNFTFLGLVRCAECGCSITAEVKHKCYPTTRGNVDYIYYRCTKKKTDCSQNYLREELLEQQLRAIVVKASLPASWVKLWLEKLDKEEVEEKAISETAIANLSSEIQEIDQKLDRLLEGYLDQVVDPQIYQQKKNELVELKIKLKEKMASTSKNGSEWLTCYDSPRLSFL